MLKRKVETMKILAITRNANNTNLYRIKKTRSIANSIITKYSNAIKYLSQ